MDRSASDSEPADNAPLIQPDDIAARRQREWENPSNWHLGGVYYAPNDDRLWVYKRMRILGMPTGWTVNFAHWGAVPSLVILVVGAGVAGRYIAEALIKKK